MEELTTFDWEQRRYEIAKEMLPVLYQKYDNYYKVGIDKDKAINMAIAQIVCISNKLIEVLKKICHE